MTFFVFQCLPKFYDCSSSQNHSCYLIPNRTEQGSCEFFSHKTQYSCTGVQLEESNICWQQLNGWQEQCAHSVDDSSVWVNETANEDFIDNVIEMFSKLKNCQSFKKIQQHVMFAHLQSAKMLLVGMTSRIALLKKNKWPEVTNIVLT